MKIQQGRIHICINWIPYSVIIHRGFLVKFNQIAELGFGLDAWGHRAEKEIGAYLDLIASYMI